MTDPAHTPTLRLSGDLEIPQIGFGTYKIEPEETERAVSAALSLRGPARVSPRPAYR